MGRPASIWFCKNRGFVTDAGGRRTLLVKGPRTRANRELAQQKFAELLTCGLTNGHNVQAHTLADVISQFLAHCELRVAAGEIKSSSLELYYRPFLSLLRKELGAWRLSQLSREQILRYRSTLTQRHLSANTIKNRLDALRTCLRWARSSGMGVPPGVDQFSSPARQRRQHIPTDEEVSQLFLAAPADVRDVLEMLTLIACRPGELFALTAGEVDLQAGLIRLNDSKIGPRIVCLTGGAAEILKRRLDRVLQPDGLCFTSCRGHRWTIRHFASQVRKARQVAGLGKHVCAYALRHVWTTRAFLNRVDLATVRQLRGDADLRTTSWYLHLSEHVSHLQQAARQAVGESDPASVLRTPPGPEDRSGSSPTPSQS